MILCVFASLSLFAASTALAVEVPNFPSCSTYSGQSVVNYSSGVHGIPGLSGEYVGSDVVYTVGDSQTLQCFCAVTGSGIQTNWWKQSSLTEQQINSLKNTGWIFIPSGQPWGLADAPYFAQNSYYNCGQPVPTPTFTPPGPGPAPVCDSAKPATPTLVTVNRNGGSATLIWTTIQTASHYTIAYGLTPGAYTYGVPNTGNVTTYTINALDPSKTYYFAVRAVNNCTPGDWSGSPSTTGQVLGLATTGTWLQIFGVLTLAIVFFVLARYAHKKASN